MVRLLLHAGGLTPSTLVLQASWVGYVRDGGVLHREEGVGLEGRLLLALKRCDDRGQLLQVAAVFIVKVLLLKMSKRPLVLRGHSLGGLLEDLLVNVFLVQGDLTI